MSTETTSVIVMGGGLVGSVLALGLANHHIKVLVLEKTPPLMPEETGDGRTTAISYGSQQILDKLGLWSELASHAQPIEEIRVFEDGSAWTVDYQHQEIGPHPMGYIVENRLLRYHLQQHLEKNPFVTWLPSAYISSIQRLAHKVVVNFNSDQTFEALLLVGAEGRLSPSRQQSSIKTRTWDYGQTALVAHLHHAKPHNNTAWEVFMTTGPLAILPMLPCPETGQHRSGIVWGKPSLWDWNKASDADLASQIQNHFPFYGDLTLCSQRWVYPLSALTTSSFVDHRLALVGDSAHVVHPIAGQGLNLGWRDADIFTKQITHAHQLGLDIGSASVLDVYNKKRKADRRSVLLATDGINRLFGIDHPLFYFLRNSGFAIANNLPPLKRLLMRKAMGV
ncbi:UbiH/UbiF/VisC/COQ6 family ubiquinone biosynthesis hydroxylase [Candidatus Finniella inopinata]|uniref:2-octaprenyl-6-methoxyphenyl hydroxylase n=1 Tax=Candidatus Finniella inopinata TaxID=1696036 RepID=A0A4Q7DKM7_9PROT|nr:UbiH/UbiF/VisC/COQ6 family ubiquinone biosynthesis hydroxylase [Candidatus Finniella inopinata]RZI46879.1 2-octaprenyl-6-methoxyphenyl hydroxylase [Candidatus Finniella inopinata]